MADPWDGHERRLTTVEKAIEDLRTGQTRNETAIADNTRITIDGLRNLNSKLDGHIEANKPVTDAIATMQTGVRVLGYLGRGVAFCAKYWYVWLGGWMFFETFITGRGVTAAIEAFWRGMKK